MTEVSPGNRAHEENPAIRRIVERLKMQPHPEGGYYCETYRDGMKVQHSRIPESQDATRSASTHIYFLLPAGDFSAFHRVTVSDEIWHLYAGDPLELHLIHEDGRYEMRLLTSDLEKGEPTALVEAGCWQAARPAPSSSYCFGGCTVAPGFEFADFEMPGAEPILNVHPEHEKIIRALTKH